MRKSTVLVAGLLVLVFGSGTLAQERSPEIAAPYAPDDLASVLPAQVGDVEVRVAWDVTDPAALATGDADLWRLLAGGVGKEEDDVRASVGIGTPPTGLDDEDIPLVIWAFRIDGTPAADWTEAFWDLALSALLGAGVRDDYAASWAEVDGRDVYSVLWTPEVMAEMRALDPEMQLPDDTGHWLYPVGEVLFWVGMPFDWPVPTPPIEDVLAELP